MVPDLVLASVHSTAVISSCDAKERAMSLTHRGGCAPHGTPSAADLLSIGPLARVIDAALDLAWMEAAGRILDSEELRVLNLADELWHARADVSRCAEDSPPDTL